MGSATRRGAWIGAAALLCASGPASAVRFDYTLDFTVERNDNLLATPTDPVALTILRPGLGFDVSHDSSRLRLGMTGRAEYRDYRDDRFDDSVDATLDARLGWSIVPERLDIVAEDRLTLQPVDTLAADSPGNRQQVNVLSAGPSLRFRWAEHWDGVVDLRWVRSTAEVTDEFNSKRVDLGLRATRALSSTTDLSLHVQGQRVDFDDDLIARDYDRYDVFARLSRRLARVDTALDLGWSRLDYRTDLPGFASSRSDPLLRAEVSWRPSEAHRVMVRGSSLFSDVAEDALTGIDLDGGIPGGVVSGDTVVNASPFLERRLDTEYTYTSARWTASISPYATRLRYSDTDDFDQDGWGVGLEGMWRMRRTLVLGGAASLDHNRYLNLDREDETRRYSLYLRYDRARHWSASLGWTRYERRSDAPGVDAEQDVFGFTLTWRNR